MSRRLLSWLLAVSVSGAVALSCYGQVTTKNSAADASAAAERGIALAAKGQCTEALLILKRSAGHLADKQVKYRAGMATARCAMSLGQTETAVQTLFALRRDFPHDPEVLYISTHYLSEMANQAAQELAGTAPGSYQAHQLEAEAFESQERWAEAAGEYQKILEQNANVPGIHFRLGRVALSKGESPENTEEAKEQFEQELKIDPSNAAAEFSLGEIARRAGQWDEAIGHFSAATRIDSGFAEAFLAKGMSLASGQRFAEAIAPLEKYVKMVPADPAGHYQLAIAYDRTGRKEDAAREMQLQRETAGKTLGSARGGTPH